MEINIDNIIYYEWGFIKLNATLVNTWIIILVLLIICWRVSHKLTADIHIGKPQALFESLVVVILDQIEEATKERPQQYLAFIGTLFVFIAISNIMGIIPGFHPPTASLSTTASLAALVFVAVPYFGIANKGWKRYLKNYIEPTPFMLPFNIIGEFSRILALAIRLFGNIMSGSLIVAILLSLSPLLFPVVMQAFGLLIGIIQAYVFAVLALVYIASAARIQRKRIINE